MSAGSGCSKEMAHPVVETMETLIEQKIRLNEFMNAFNYDSLYVVDQIDFGRSRLPNYTPLIANHKVKHKIIEALEMVRVSIEKKISLVSTK